ncbi:hypothetical protein HK102_011592, partial [Quaeritorhiza haematococci]
MSDKTGTKTQLSPTTPEFAYLEYALQLALRATTARIVAAYVVSNPHLAVQFDRRCKDSLVLSSWLDSSVLVGVNTEEEVIRRGFQFAAAGPQQNGMKVSVGAIRPNRGLKADPQHDQRKVTKKVVFCKVGVGRAFISDEASAETGQIPEGYDSFYLRDTSVLSDSKQGPPQEYYHEYYLKNPAQILPQYVIHYEFDPTRERRSREKARCDNCEIEVATVYCAADAANLCNKCDSKLHETKLASRHVRSPIGKGADIFGHCRHHPDKMIEFFCAQCHIPVCVYCKMVGNHANGEASKHQLVSVTEAYHTVLQEAQAHDPILQSRRTEITNQIAAVNSRAKAVDKMAAQIQHQIDEMYRRAVEDLKVIVKKKMDILLGDELELKRQIGEIERLDEFLKYQQMGDATQFLFCWARHQQLRSELHDFAHFRNEIDVQLDVKATGGISVVIDQSPNALIAPAAGANVGGMHHQHPGAKKTIKGGAMPPPQVGMGLPKKMQERRIHRRTSDFFAETLGAFDQFAIDDD